VTDGLTAEQGPAGFRSGFVSVVGRPNVGKSTLVNQLVGTKVAIVSDRPQTTRTQIRGVRTTDAHQMVFLDTPGLHKPRTPLGARTNERARATLGEVDVVCMVVDATAPIGRGDRFVAGLVGEIDTPTVLVVSKVDVAARASIAEHLATAAADLGAFHAFVPLSGLTGEGTEALLAELHACLPPGPHYYPDGMVTDQPETFLAAELLREQLLRVARDELPHSIAVVVEEAEDAAPEPGAEPSRHDPSGDEPEVLRLRARVLVERDSQKGIVIGRGGTVIRDAGTAARRELEALLGVRVHLETSVAVERDWQRRAHSLDRLGF
jgi:GTPase